MENQSSPSPDILPQSNALPVETTPELTPIPDAPKRGFQLSKWAFPVGAGFIVLIVLLTVVSSMGSGGGSSGGNQPTPTLAALTPTPTPINKNLMPFATESAFLQFESTVENLPKVIQGAVLSDPTILPPVLNLPLGF